MDKLTTVNPEALSVSSTTSMDMGKDSIIGTGKKQMQILFITQDDPFYVRLFFEEFFRIFENNNEISGVVIAEAMGKKSKLDLARQMLNFYGTMDFLKIGFRYVAYKTYSRFPFIKNGKFSIACLCEHYGVNVFYENRINSKEFLGRLKKMNIDLIISVAAPVIFKSDIISIPRLGCINIHNGKLPRYRGMLPNFWQMYNGEKSVGITIHEINPRIDDGKIILQKDVEILPDETLDSLIKRTKKIGARVMIEAIDMIRNGNVQYRENPVSEGTYYSFPTKEDVKEFKRRGKRIT